MLRKTALAFALLFGAAPLLAAPATATPHAEREDGCDHGATGKPCRPDPQPDHGKDCELHGNHGGVNEDHCLTNPTTSTTTTTTTLPATTDTTTATAPTKTLSVPAVDTQNVTPNLGCVTPDGHPYLTNVEQGGCGAVSVADLNDAKATNLPTQLPHTGADAGLLFVIGTAVLMAGLSCWFCGKAID